MNRKTANTLFGLLHIVADHPEATQTVVRLMSHLPKETLDEALASKAPPPYCIVITPAMEREGQVLCEQRHDSRLRD